MTIPYLDGNGATRYAAGTHSGGSGDPDVSLETINTALGALNIAVSAIEDKTPAFGQALMAESVPIVVASNQSPIPIMDNGGSITVDGAIDTELTTADLDTGAGTDTRAVVGLVLAANGGGALVGTANPMPISDNGGSITVDGTVAVSGTVTVDSELTTADLDTGAGTDTRAVVGLVLAASGGGALVGAANPMPISDNGGSITVDGTVAVSGTVTVDSELTTSDLDTGAGTDTRAVVGLVYGASGGGVLVSTTNPLPISDNGGSITVDGAIDTELTTADLDTGAGTDTRAVVGLVLAANGGGALVGTANPMPISDNGGSITVDGTVAVSGTVTVDSELTTADLDTGAGTDTRAVVGLVTAASGGGVLVSSANPLPVTTPSTSNGGSAAKTADYDTGAGTDTVVMHGIALPASGGAVAGGTSTNPVRTDPTGTTTQPVSVALPSTVYNGQTNVTTAGTRVALASSRAIVSGVTIKAKSTNTGFIYVGSSAVTSSNGFILAAGESVFMEIANLNTINLDASVSGEGVSYIAS